MPKYEKNTELLEPTINFKPTIEIKKLSPPVVFNMAYKIWSKRKRKEHFMEKPTRKPGGVGEAPPTTVRRTSLIQKLDKFLNTSVPSKGIVCAFDEMEWYDSAKLTGDKSGDIISNRNIVIFENKTCIRKAFGIVTIFEGLITFDRYKPSMFTLDGMTYKQLFDVINKETHQDEQKIMKRIRAYGMLLTIGQGQLGISKEMIHPKIRAPLRTSASAVSVPPFQQTVEKSQH